jgi:hypothetical protein
MFAARQWKFLFKTFKSFKRQAPFKTFEQTMAITFDISRNAQPATLLQVNSRQKSVRSLAEIKASWYPSCAMQTPYKQLACMRCRGRRLARPNLPGK